MATTEIDIGVAFHMGCLVVSHVALAAAKHRATGFMDNRSRGVGNGSHRAAAHVHVGVVGHLAQLTAAIYVADDRSARKDIHLRVGSAAESI